MISEIQLGTSASPLLLLLTSRARLFARAARVVTVFELAQSFMNNFAVVLLAASVALVFAGSIGLGYVDATQANAALRWDAPLRSAATFAAVARVGSSQLLDAGCRSWLPGCRSWLHARTGGGRLLRAAACAVWLPDSCRLMTPPRDDLHALSRPLHPSQVTAVALGCVLLLLASIGL